MGCHGGQCCDHDRSYDYHGSRLNDLSADDDIRSDHDYWRNDNDRSDDYKRRNDNDATRGGSVPLLPASER